MYDSRFMAVPMIHRVKPYQEISNKWYLSLLVYNVMILTDQFKESYLCKHFVELLNVFL